jgi:hypothetical protein
LVDVTPTNKTRPTEETAKPVIIKRSNSIKKVDKEQEEKEKRDHYKAKIAWTASSPKGQQNIITFH